MKYINIKKGYTKDDIVNVSKIIKDGGVVILPTDTVYGLVADVNCEEAIKRIFELKKRSLKNPMSILVSNTHMIENVTNNMTELEKKAINALFPGAITIILEKNEYVSDIVTSGLDTVGVRIPENKFLLELIAYMNEPIVATSCNLAGEVAMTDIKSIMSEFEDKVEAIIDEGKSKIGTPSTVIKVDDSNVKILRDGPIGKEEIFQKINKKG